MEAEETPPCPYYNRGHCSAEVSPTETANYPTPLEPVGKRNVKRVQHVQCVIQGHVICSSDQAEDATEKAAVTDTWQRKKTLQFL